MAPDAGKDARRATLWTLASGALLLGLLVAEAATGLRPEWKARQQRLAESGFSGPRLGRVSQLRDACTGELDRCVTCHPGKDGGKGKSGRRDLFLDAHAADIAVHFDGSIGCSVCHGGNGRALESAAAHLWAGQKEPRLKRPYLEAACARCHVPGEGGTEHLMRGALLYLELGCQMCHPLNSRGLGGWDFGPDLTRPGLRSLAQFERSLLDPTADFAESTMPSFAATFSDRREQLEDLLVYLLSLSLAGERSCPGPRVRADALAGASCTMCHAGDAGRASGRLRHACRYILDRADELRCSGCHREKIGPDAETSGCAVQPHRRHCSACHQEKGTP